MKAYLVNVKMSSTDLYICIKRMLKRHNIDMIESYYMFDSDELEKCDFCIQIGPPGPASNLRTYIKYACDLYKMPILYFDAGFFNPFTKRRHYSISVNNVKGLGHHMNDEYDSKRWDKLGVNLHDWRETGEGIVALLHWTGGFASSYYSEAEQAQQLQVVKQQIGSQLKVRAKSPVGLYEDIVGKWCCVAWHTNATIDAMIYGIPSVVLDQASMLYKHCTNHISGINTVKTFDRLPVLHQLAYAQWTSSEISKGIPLDNFIQYNKKYKWTPNSK